MISLQLSKELGSKLSHGVEGKLSVEYMLGILHVFWIQNSYELLLIFYRWAKQNTESNWPMTCACQWGTRRETLVYLTLICELDRKVHIFNEHIMVPTWSGLSLLFFLLFIHYYSKLFIAYLPKAKQYFCGWRIKCD